MVRLTQPIAIVGIGCRFPGAKGPSAFWQLLENAVDAITRVPEDRWGIAARDTHFSAGDWGNNWGGFLDDVDQFDAQFFRISPREAERMDPQQRLLLELAWEALEDAGLPPKQLEGSKTGVFVGMASNDYGRLNFADQTQTGLYNVTGSGFSIAANRISYFFDFSGVSLAIDTATSSSAVAVDLACRSLNSGESELALAGGVNLILSPDIASNLSHAGLMAADGRCKAFDATADGYVRGEGGGLIVLKRLKDAQDSGDRIYAIIGGAAVNQNGASAGLTVPNQSAQEELLQSAFMSASITADQVHYIEAHGSGTPLGDSVEALALGAVLSNNRTTEDPVLLGSVKTNIGHLEAAAGIAGLIKAALSLYRKQIPQSLHFSAPNSHIPFEQLPLRVVQESVTWPDYSRPAIAGVSSFGLGGTNAHIVLVEAPEPVFSKVTQNSSCPGRAFLLPLSAKSVGALTKLIADYHQFLSSKPTDDFADIAYTASVRRTHHACRVAVVAKSASDAAEQLLQLLDRSTDDDSGTAINSTPEKAVLTAEQQSAPSLAHLKLLASSYTAGSEIDWPTLYPDGGRLVELPSYPWDRQRYWVESASSKTPSAQRVERDDVVITDLQLEKVPAHQRSGVLRQFINEQIVAVLKMAPGMSPDPDKTLFDLGMDSLMVSDLANRLRQGLGDLIKITPADMFDYPSIKLLHRFIGEKVDARSGVRVTDEPTQSRMGQSLASAQQALSAKREPIAVIGLGCRFPGGANSPDKFWRLIENGGDAITSIPKERWALDDIYNPDPETPGKMYVRVGGFLDCPVDSFDADFFSISPREAAWMDPQQRLLLEVAWESLENAGIDPTSLRGTRTGVFVGASSNDYMTLINKKCRLEEISAYWGTGNSNSIIAGRLAYVLGVEGPSWTVDTACSSSLVAVHNACSSLQNGEADCAIAGGVSLILAPELSVNFCRAKMLSADGRCKTFDAEADGYVRSEGCGVIVLKRLSQALRDGDRVLAVIRGSAVNQDGASNTLTAPNGLAQENLIRTALFNAGLSPSDIDLIEAHGTGTALGDPIEVNAISRVFSRKGRPPLALASVKTNIGHLESAAGIAGLIKVVLALHHETIPAHLNLQRLNPMIELDTIPAFVPASAIPWPARSERPRRAGVSSFGFSGTNAHAILEEAPGPAARSNQNVPGNYRERTHHVMTISARSRAALQKLAEGYVLHIKDRPQFDLADLAYTANTGRAHCAHRIALVARDTNDLTEKLLHLDCFQGEVLPDTLKPRIAFVFSGSTSRHALNARELYAAQPVFRSAIDECSSVVAACLDQQSPVDLLKQTQSQSGERLFEQTVSFAIAYAFARLWQSYGVQADFVSGQGAGHYVAAVIENSIDITSAISTLLTSPCDDAQVPVRSFVEDVLSQGCRIFIDVGCQPPLSESLLGRGSDSDLLCVSSLRKDEETWPVLLEGIARLYVHGVDIDWQSFDRPFPRSKVTLPTYAFQRRRHWFADLQSHQEDRDGSDCERRSPRNEQKIDDLIYQVVWRPERKLHLRAEQRRSISESCRRAIRAQCDSVLQEEETVKLLSEHQTFSAEVQSLCMAYVGRAFQQLGWQPGSYDPAHTASLLDRLMIVRRHRRLADRCLAALMKPAMFEEAIGPDGDGTADSDLDVRFGKLRGRYAAFSDELIVLDRCGRKLADIWRGTEDPLTLLFPQDGSTSADDWYRSSAPFKIGNSLVSRALRIMATDSPRPLRILEIGAGTGATTDLILSHLPAQSEYTFTDVSTHFLNHAKERYAAYPVVRFELLDIEKEPKHQGFAPGAYDIVIASNVLHATRDMEETIGNVRQLVAPAGSLFLLEGTKEQLHLDLTFGLLPGWWRFADCKLRTQHPLIKGSDWKALLEHNGFDDIQLTCVGPAESATQVLIMAQAAIQQQCISPDEKVLETAPWIVFSDSKGIGRSVAERLRACGESVISVHADTDSDQPEHDSYAGVIDLRPGTVSRVSLSPGRKEAISALFTKLKTGSIAGLIYCWGVDVAVDSQYGITEQQRFSCGTALYIVQALQRLDLQKTPKIWFATQGAQCLPGQSSVSVMQAPISGLCKVISLEHPEYACRLIDLDPDYDSDEAGNQLFSELWLSDKEDQVALRQDQRYVARLHRGASASQSMTADPVPAACAQSSASSQVHDDAVGSTFRQPTFVEGTHLITGGFGGVGIELAGWLVDRGAKHIALLGRNGPSEPGLRRLEAWRANGVTINVLRTDVGNRGELERTLRTVRQNMPPLRAVFHAAGSFSDAILNNQSWQRFEEVFHAKVLGSWHLHELTVSDKLEHFVLFSSTASLLGAAGLSSYSSANAFLDGLAHYRRSIGLPALCVNWGPWSGIGVAARTVTKLNTELNGLRGLTADLALTALASFLTDRSTTQIGCAAIDWDVTLQSGRSRRSLFKELAPTACVLPWENLSRREANEDSDRTAFPPVDRLTNAAASLRATIETGVRAVLRWPEHEDLEGRRGFFDMGMDSLMTVELANRLGRELGTQAALTTLAIMDHPTIESLCQYLSVRLGLIRPDSDSQLPAVSPAVAPEDIAIVGVGCRFPGGANDPEQFWSILDGAIDAVAVVPKERWDIERYYDPDPSVPGRMHVRESGFLDVPIDRFDSEFFGISAREAEWIDPQQRLLLEVTWEALENAGIDPTSLQGTLAGVFIGASTNEYEQLICKNRSSESISPFVTTGNLGSALSGRLAYVLGAQGPSLVIDTACSSSLVAVHTACQSLLNGESECAIAGGVNLMLVPQVTINFCKANMLSSDGRCKTFDAGADGFGRGEGCGVVVLKRLSSARKDGDRVLAVIRSSCINQDGSSSGLTVPNGVAQEKLIRTALHKAGLSPCDIDVIEAHGTGTPLGDPIEVNSLSQVFTEGRTADSPLVIGSVKTNIGHLEAAAGIAGLIKMVLALQHESIPAHLHLKEVNPLIQLDQIPAVVPRSKMAWARRTGRPRRAGVSSFGISGTNAHVILEEAPPAFEGLEEAACN